MKKQRRHFGGSEKVAILRQHLVEKVPVSDLCDQRDINPTQFYSWLKDFFENGLVGATHSRCSNQHCLASNRLIDLTGSDDCAQRMKIAISTLSAP